MQNLGTQTETADTSALFVSAKCQRKLKVDKSIHWRSLLNRTDNSPILTLCLMQYFHIIIFVFKNSRTPALSNLLNVYKIVAK